MKKTLETIKTILEIFCCIVISVMSVIVLLQVINRNMFDKSFVWVEELAGLCMVSITFLGAALATCSNQHTRIDFLIMKLPRRGTLLVSALGNLVCCGFAFFLVRYAFPLIQKNWTSLTPRLKLPYGINYLSVFIGCGLMIIYYLALAADNVKEFAETPKGASNNPNESMEKEAEEALNQ